MITFRDMCLDTDISALLQLISLKNMDSVTPGRVRVWWSPKFGESRQTKLAINEDNQIVGMVDTRSSTGIKQTNFRFEVMVFPQWRRLGIGSQLFDIGLQFMRSHNALSLESAVRDDDLESLKFMQKHGFKITRHSIESRLDLAKFNNEGFSELIEFLRNTGFCFFSLADLGPLSVQSQEKLYDLNRFTAMDNPGSSCDFPSFSIYSKNVFETSWFHAEDRILASFEDQWVGLSSIAYHSEGNYAYNAFTGVLPKFRNLGIATALKTYSIKQAKKYGANYIRTNNDDRNFPILAVNQKMGYHPLFGINHLAYTR